MAQLKAGTTIGGYIAWHAGNDGAGSGLDADLLDGMQPTSPGGTEANRIAATDADGRVGRAINSDQLGGVAASSYARKDVTETFAADLNVNGGLWVARNTTWGATRAITLPIGDNDTGLHWVNDGELWLYSNSIGVIRLVASNAEVHRTMDFNVGSGRIVLPVGVDKYAV